MHPLINRCLFLRVTTRSCFFTAVPFSMASKRREYIWRNYSRSECVQIGSITMSGYFSKLLVIIDRSTKLHRACATTWNKFLTCMCAMRKYIFCVEMIHRQIPCYVTKGWLYTSLMLIERTKEEMFTALMISVPWLRVSWHLYVFFTDTDGFQRGCKLEGLHPLLIVTYKNITVSVSVHVLPTACLDRLLRNKRRRIFKSRFLGI